MSVGGGFELRVFGEDVPTRHDAVLFAGSVAELFTTHGDLGRLVSPHRALLKRVRYDRACCAAFAFDERSAATVRAQRGSAGSSLSLSHTHEGVVREFFFRL